MKDIFYFNSPSQSTSVGKHRLTPETRPSPSKKRFTTNDEMFAQRACIAYFEEPTFCPNNAPPLFSSASFLHIPSSANDMDDIDDEPGGVPVSFYDTDMADTVHNSTMTGTSSPNTYELRSSANSSLPERPQSSTSIPVQSQSSRHTSLVSSPRSQFNEPLEEEDGRRQRLGLSSPPSQDVLQSEFTAARPRRPRQHATRDERRLDHMHVTTSSRIPTASLSLTAQSHSVDADFVGTTTQQDLEDMQLDDETISVDDPRHLYDFACFMDLWRLRSTRQKHLPKFEPGLQSSVRLGRPVKGVPRKQVEAGTTDMQGIHWKLIGPRREQAAAARIMLHPYPATAIKSSQPSHTSRASDPQYRFRSFLPKHKASFKHYQLRNALAASSRNEVFYSTGNQVQMASLACPDLNETLIDLSKPSGCSNDFRITCLSASRREAGTNGVVFAGGFNGEYAMFDLDTNSQTTVEGIVTHAYNGLVTHIHTIPDRRSGLLHAVFCSNDRKVRLMDVRSLKFTDTFSYDYAVNCSATSPDGRLRVIVGDSSEVIIADASRGNPLVTLRDQTDHGFACDWSKDGRYVATSAQDGKTVVWDARNWSEPVQTLYSAMSCARSLNFTDDGALIVAENDDIVRTYDGGIFASWQDTHFFGSIAGVTLLDGGAEMVVANADRTVGGLLTFERALGRGSYGMRVPREKISGPRKRSFGSSDLLTDLLL